jgi:hypothetical protein
MSDGELTAQQAETITASVDIKAVPPDAEPVAMVLFGTNQATPVQIVAERYHKGATPDAADAHVLVKRDHLAPAHQNEESAIREDRSSWQITSQP